MDIEIFRALNGKGVDLAAILSSKWVFALISGSLLAFWARKKHWQAILITVMAMAISDLIVVRILKPTVNRERPCRALKNVVAPTGCGPGKSFPSAHSSNAFALTISAAPNIPHGYLVLLPIALGVAWSRMAVGVHYPTDVFFGACLGALIAILCRFGVLRISKSRRATNPSSPSA